MSNLTQARMTTPISHTVRCARVVVVGGGGDFGGWGARTVSYFRV